MSEGYSGADPYRAPGGGGVWALTALLALVCGGAWYGWRAMQDRQVAEISIVEYFRIKPMLDEVRIEGQELYGRVSGGYRVDGRSYPLVHANIPPAYLTTPKGVEALISGIDPSKLKYGPGH